MSDVEPTSVKVSWQAAENADRYNVTLSKIVGQGLCPSDSHTVSVVTSDVSVLVGHTAEDMLRPHTKYSITVGAMDDAIESTQYGIPVTFITNQTSEFYSQVLFYLVWLELGRTTKHSRKGKRVIRKWRLDRLGDDGVKLKYIMALQAEVSRFSESIQSKVASGMVGSTLVMNVLADWENIVNEVAKAVVGEKLIVCGKVVECRG